MFEKMKEKLPGMKGKEMPEEDMKKKAMPGVEIEIESGEEEGQDMESPEGSEEEVAVGELAKLSDEELMAEAEKRGMVISKPGESEASAEAESPEQESEENKLVPKKKA